MSRTRSLSWFVAVLLATMLVPTVHAEPSEPMSAHYPNPQFGEFLQTWNLLGPIAVHSGDDAPDRSEFKKLAFDHDLLAASGGEAKADVSPGVAVDGVGAWSSYTTKDDTVDLDEALALKSWSTAYASATISCDEPKKAVLGIGSDDAVKVWLNGRVIHENWIGRASKHDDDLVPLELNQGENHLLLKVVNWEHGAAFSCRVLSKQNLTKHLVRAAARREQDRIKDLLAAGADINARNEHGLTPYFAAKVKGNDKIARMLEVLGANPDAEFDAANFVQSLLDSDTTDDKPGIALLVSSGDEILLRHAAGAANLEHSIPVTAETKFRIGSVTKQFTAAAILKLQEEGKLSVQDPLSKFIPDFPRGDEVTIHHMLTHTSGLKNFTSKPDFYDTVASRVEERDMIKEFKEDGFDFDPGTKFEYCNTGYFLLGHIVGEVSGQSFGEYLKSTFFDPLGMVDTGVHDSSGVYPHEATGYSIEGDTVRKALDWDMSRAGGAGNIYSTVGDLHRWNRGIFSGELLTAASLQAAHTINEVAEGGSIEIPYGYGWMMDEHRGLKRISHSGGLNGFVSQLTYYPEQEVTVTALHNAFPSVGSLTPGLVCDAIAEAFLWRDMQARPKYILATNVDPDTYDDYVGKYDYRTAIMTVSREEDKLMAQIFGQPKFEIFPMGNDKFFWKVVDAQAEFIRDASGHVTSVRHSQGIAKFVADRLEERKEVELSDELLDRFVGEYAYKGLGKMTIRREGKRLLAKLTGQPELELCATSETELFWRNVNARIAFEIDDVGNIAGGTHYQGGAELPVTRVD